MRIRQNLRFVMEAVKIAHVPISFLQLHLEFRIIFCISMFLSGATTLFADEQRRVNLHHKIKLFSQQIRNAEFEIKVLSFCC